MSVLQLIKAGSYYEIDNCTVKVIAIARGEGSLADTKMVVFSGVYGNRGIRVRSVGEFAALAEPSSYKTATTGMCLGDRVRHVGGRSDENSNVVFGSYYALAIFVEHLVRDLYGSAGTH